MTERILAHKPPRIAMLLLLAAAATQWLTPLPGPRLFQSLTAASCMSLAGLVVMLRAWWQFREARVAICPTAKTERLITSGIYALTRNPMYLGITLMLAGVTAWIGTVPFIGATSGFFLIMDRIFCPFEEQKLLTAFGANYQAYKSRVRRWI